MEAKCSLDEDILKKKRKLSGLPEEIPPVLLEETVKNVAGSFQPLHLISEWVEPGTTTRRLTVAILLPSGVAIGQFSTRVSDDGNTLFLVIMWPDPLVNLKHLHRKWLTAKGPDKIELYHPKLVGFEHFLKSCRSRSTDSVESTARISLPFQVQTHISQKYNLGWNDSSARVVYVELRGHEEHYGTVQDDSSFEIC